MRGLPNDDRSATASYLKYPTAIRAVSSTNTFHQLFREHFGLVQRRVARDGFDSANYIEKITIRILYRVQSCSRRSGSRIRSSGDDLRARDLIRKLVRNNVALIAVM